MPAVATTAPITDPTADPAADTRPTTRVRAEIPAEFRWDFSAIYTDWPAWDEAQQQMEALMQRFTALAGTLAQGAQALLAAYRLHDEIGQLQFRVYRFAQLQRDVDATDQRAAAAYQRVLASFARFDGATAWFTPELLRIPEPEVRRWLDETPDLAPYRFTILDEFRRRTHVLGEEAERVLALAGPVGSAARMAYDELSTHDVRFADFERADRSRLKLSHGAYRELLATSPDADERRRAAEAFLGVFGASEHTYAALYRGVLERDWFIAQARGFGDTLQAKLFTHAIPPQVVHTLLEVTRAGTAPLQRYFRLRRRLLGLEVLRPCDAFVPLVRCDRRYPFARTRELTLQSVAPLGEGYVERFRRFVGGGRIDVYENDAKRAGAYNAGVYGVGPYLLLNHNDTLDALFTFAHEAGHALHTVLSYERQPFATSAYTIFVAEVASTTAERYLLEHLLRHTDDPRERFVLLQHAADQIVGTFYNQVLYADFELQAHRLVEQGQAVTAEGLNALMLSLMRQAYGDAVQVDDFYRHNWARISHFYASPYYVYQYATCFASSAHLFEAMTTGDEASRTAARERYLELLASGGNDHPMTQLQRAGVDLTQRATVQAVIDQMDQLVARMESEADALS